jgi:hypothetical protein
MREPPSSSQLSADSHKFEIHGFYRQGYPDGPWRPFVRVFVALPRFGAVKQVDMIVDSGADVTSLQPRDSLLLLEEAQFAQLKRQHKVQGIGGLTSFFQEDAAIGIPLANNHICWIPVMLNISGLDAPPAILSGLGNDVMQHGITHLDAINSTVKIELWLPHPLVT